MSIKSFWINYCEKSSIHGLRYVIQKDARPWERLMWSILLAIAAATILVHLYASWEQYSYSSMQIVVDNPRYPLSKIDFPAVTFCPVNKILYSKAKQLFLDAYENNTKLQKQYENSLLAMGMLQYPNFKDLSTFIKRNSVLEIPRKNLTEFMLELMPSVDDVFHGCFWRGSGHNCTEMIRLQRTEEGFCYSFNSKTAERTEDDSELNPPMEEPDGTLTPLRNNAAGKMSGFEVILNTLFHEYFPDDNRDKGYNVVVHTPEDFPDVTSGYKIYAEYNLLSRISVSVSHMKADVSLQRLHEKDRKCFMYKNRMAGKRMLPSHKSNAEDNCYSRCRLDTIYLRCGCSPYYFDVKENAENCGIEHISCLGRMNVLQRNVQAPDNEPGFPKWSMPPFMNCSCTHPCSFVGYTTELRKYEKDIINYKELTKTLMHIDIHYKEPFAISFQRSMKYTTQDLLVTFGGMASLFLGISLVSLVEIVYIIYKSLLMFKHKYTKVKTIPRHSPVILYRRHHHYHFCKPLYRPPVNKISTISYSVKQ